MDADELRWLLRTIEEPQTARRFVLAQYERGRISLRVAADVVRERQWITQSAIQALATATHRSLEYAPMETLTAPCQG